METEPDSCYPVMTGETEWGKTASNVPDPPKCMEVCRVRFLHRLLGGYTEAKFAEACGILSKSPAAKEKLWDLYCCDTMVCGLSLDGKTDIGKDPGVNLIINTCQNIGSATVSDPGPPPSEYTCPAWTLSNKCEQSFMVGDPRPYTDTVPSTLTAEPPWPDFPPTATSSASSAKSTRPAVMTSAASSSAQSNAQRPSGGGLPRSAKIAVGITSAIAFLAIAAVVICLYRRRSRRGYTQSIKSEIKHHPLPPTSSPTPLISPAASTHEGIQNPLTPPPRLKERRLLSTLLSPAPSIGSAPFAVSPITSPISSAARFPDSPINVPIGSRFAPRQDRSPRSPTLPPPPPPPPPAGGGVARKAFKTASVSSSGSYRTATTVSNASSGFPHLTPASPYRPTRPHDAPLRIPDLVCPGPPPTRALPPAPPVSPVSPMTPAPLFRQQSADYGHNISLALAAGYVPPRNPARGVVLGKEARDFCELTESYARESKERDSWGSWSIGAGGPGIGRSNSSNQKGGGRTSSTVLEESDLERMGGRY
ncbi:hypothetical protein CMUS01_02818 [Colletotrichum musicola]|uniref:Uncharacterized protein n=1 Tax=Colletotrichum musicola TaxID=2175873 RepID=A0A8H6NUG9_9PEZI|nr:hypothetical protein CMUS01_02818 [Colletotrichum musicola]